jgi:diketogulonate reductase-like aldo/keto reductase
MKLLAEGRVRAIGVSNFRPNDLDKLIEQTGHVPTVNQVELHPFFNQRELRNANEKYGIITQAWLAIFDFTLTSEEVQAINALDIGPRGGPGPEQVSPHTFPVTIQD